MEPETVSALVLVLISCALCFIAPSLTYLTLDHKLSGRTVVGSALPFIGSVAAIAAGPLITLASFSNSASVAWGWWSFVLGAGGAVIASIVGLMSKRRQIFFWSASVLLPFAAWIGVIVLALHSGV